MTVYQMDHVGGCLACYGCLRRLPLEDLRHPIYRMVVCPTCGNKRCPRATNHELACTGSNEPGQEGSIYR